MSSILSSGRVDVSPSYPDDDHVDKIPEFLRSVSLSIATWKRLPPEDRPVLTQLSVNRVGVRRRDRREWLDRRARRAP